MITDWLAGYDLVPAFMLFSLIGVAMCVRVMIEVAHERIGSRDHPLVRVLRRTGLLLVSLALLESLVFGHDKMWQPWPPHLMMVVGLDIWLLGVNVSAYYRNKMAQRQSHRVGILRRRDKV